MEVHVAKGGVVLLGDVGGVDADGGGAASGMDMCALAGVGCC